MPEQHHHGAAKKKRARRIRNAFFFSLSNDSPAELHFNDIMTKLLWMQGSRCDICPGMSDDGESTESTRVVTYHGRGARGQFSFVPSDLSQPDRATM